MPAVYATQIQCDRVLSYLKEHGQLDPLTAWKELGVYRLAAVIFFLRAHYKIITLRKPVKNKFGEDCSVALYIFEGLKTTP